ncbi:autoinhibited Ca(2+)-ATPase 10 [Striga asiatica]|uniref:Autoinhibited Ca(2+)-ATPase 10 n=1 Tax=Striga asiatica TaxID=4170 RepID=A0A5A7Q7G4_STRAF|nr:autoinhibited Ca(2+)-ATPase 10 [Striga asiatica]
MAARRWTTTVLVLIESRRKGLENSPLWQDEPLFGLASQVQESGKKAAAVIEKKVNFESLFDDVFPPRTITEKIGQWTQWQIRTSSSSCSCGWLSVSSAAAAVERHEIPHKYRDHEYGNVNAHDRYIVDASTVLI